MSVIFFNPYRFAKPASFAFTASAANTSASSSYTFSSLSLGQADSSRRIIVALAGQNAARTVTSLTVAGVAATRIIGDNPIAPNGPTVQLWIANVPTGTTGNVVVTLNGNFNSCAVGLYAAYDLTTNTPHASNQSALASSTSIAFGLAHKAGFIIAAAASSENAITSFTWTGVNENFDVLIGSSSRAASSASLTTSDDGTLTITATPNASGSLRLVAASFY